MGIQFFTLADWIKFMGDLFRNKGRLDPLVTTKNNINTLALPHSLGSANIFQVASPCARLSLSFACPPLCCQHKEGRLRERRVRGNRMRQKPGKRQAARELMKGRDERERDEDARWGTESRREKQERPLTPPVTNRNSSSAALRTLRTAGRFSQQTGCDEHLFVQQREVGGGGCPCSNTMIITHKAVS